MPKTLPQPDLNAGIEPDGRAIRREVARYRAPDPIRSLAQSSITIGGYLCACAAMFVLFSLLFPDRPAPETEPWGERYCQFADPNGLVWQLVEWV